MFNSVKSNTVPERIIEQIRQAIFEGALKPGDKLPPEKELIKNFDVSKATLREALRSLEVLGFLEMRKGALGGPVVTEIDMKKVGDYFANFLFFKNLSIKDLFEVRLLIESHVAEKAAQMISEEDLVRLESLIEEWDQIIKEDRFTATDKNLLEFHRIIGDITENPILSFILDFVETLITDVNAILKPGKEFYQRVLDSHKQIYKALVEKNAQKVRQEMINHVKRVERDLLTLQEERNVKNLNLGGTKKG